MCRRGSPAAPPGILNTMRNIGQVLGIAVLGSVLQNRMGIHTENALEPIGLDSDTVAQVKEFASQNQFQQVLALIPTEQIGAVTEILKESFVLALHNTFLVGAIACGIASLLALLIRNPRPAEVTQVAQGATAVERAEASLADSTAYPA